MEITGVFVMINVRGGTVTVQRLRDGRLMAHNYFYTPCGVRQTKTPGKYWYRGGKTVGHELPLAAIQLFERGELVWPEPSAGGGA